MKRRENPSAVQTLRRKGRARDAHRREHIDDLLALLHPELDKPLSECRVLDVGCGPGVLALTVAPRVAYLKGIDANAAHIQACEVQREREGISNVEFEMQSLYGIEPTGDFDIVLMSDVLEHVVRQREALERGLGALRPGGVIYLSTNNRWWPTEGHMRLPFLTYLPKRLANRYVRATKRGSSYEGYYLLGYFALRKLLDSLDVDYAFKPPQNPESAIYRAGSWLVGKSSLFWSLANAFQVVIKKGRTPAGGQQGSGTRGVRHASDPPA